MQVFVSSLIRGFEEYREAAASAIQDLGYDVVRAEDFPASTDTPQQACLAGVRQSDLVVLLLSTGYGYPQASGVSATHEEYLEARETKPLLAFLHEGVDLDPGQNAFVQTVRDWSGGSLTGSFRSPDDLRRVVTRALHQHGIRTAGAPAVDLDLAVDQARTALQLEAQRWDHDPQLVLGVAGLPSQPLLRPAEMEDPDLRRELKQVTLFGDWPLFDSRSGIAERMIGDFLVLEQERSALAFDAAGTLRIAQSPMREIDESRYSLRAVIEEDVRESIERGLRLGHWVLDRIDPTHRVSDVVPVVALKNAGYAPWRTRDEHARSPNSMTMRGSDQDVTVELVPPARRRSAMGHQADVLAEDFTVLLRRSIRSE